MRQTPYCAPITGPGSMPIDSPGGCANRERADLLGDRSPAGDGPRPMARYYERSSVGDAIGLAIRINKMDYEGRRFELTRREEPL